MQKKCLLALMLFQTRIPDSFLWNMNDYKVNHGHSFEYLMQIGTGGVRLKKGNK